MVSEDEVVTGSIGLTERDLVLGVREISNLFRFRWLLLALTSVMFGIAAVSNSSVCAAHNLPELVGLGVFYLAIFAGPRWSARRLYRSLIKAGDSQVFYRFDAQGVTIRASGQTTSFAYRLLSRFRETAATFLLKRDGGLTTIVPKRAFADAEVSRLRALLSAEVKHEPGRGLGRAGKLVVLWVALVFAFVVMWQFLNARPR